MIRERQCCERERRPKNSVILSSGWQRRVDGAGAWSEMPTGRFAESCAWFREWIRGHVDHPALAWWNASSHPL